MIRNKKVVILAGSSGIGLQVARHAAERGAHVTITGRSDERLRQAQNELPGKVEISAFDATDRPRLAAFLAQQGIIDHLVSCVGDTEWGGFLDLDEARARNIIEHKFWAQLFIVKTAKDMVRKDGSITLTGGTSAARAMIPFGAAYSIACNTMLEALVKGLAAELAPLRINVVQPTVTDTNLFQAMTPDDRQQLFGHFAKMLPIGRIPQPSDVALTYIHLMESGLVNGDAVRPDGGPLLPPS